MGLVVEYWRYGKYLDIDTLFASRVAARSGRCAGRVVVPRRDADVARNVRHVAMGELRIERKLALHVSHTYLRVRRGADNDKVAMFFCVLCQV
jgi:hypothetical protein